LERTAKGVCGVMTLTFVRILDLVSAPHTGEQVLDLLISTNGR
jgi:hypothetical protein